MANATVIQVMIDALSLTVRTAVNKHGDEDLNVFRFTISRPAEGIEEVETVKMIKAGEKMPKNWDDHDLAMVFKTRLRGKAVLRVKALAIDKDSNVERRLRKFFGTVLSLSFATWTGGLSNAYVGAVAKAAGTTLFAGDKADDADVDVLGEGSLEIDSRSLQPKKTHRVELLAPRAVVRKSSKRKQMGRRWVRSQMKEEIIKKGQKTGQLHLVLTRLDAN